MHGSVSRMIVFIGCGFLRPSGFLGIRRIAYECSCPALLFPVKKADGRRYVPPRSVQLGSIGVVTDDAARSRSPFLDFTRQKQSRYRRHPWRKDWHHLQTRRTYFCEAQCGKPYGRCIGGTETYRSAAPAPESKPGQAWNAIAGFITTQLCALCSDGPDLYGEFVRLIA